MNEILGNYYGLDWIGMAGSLIFLFLVGSKKRYSFIIYTVGNIAWIAVNYMGHIWPGVILNIILIALNARAYAKWKK
ncbi:hypothetical protein ACFL3C_01405 [Patescibacteria group bacterium]